MVFYLFGRFDLMKWNIASTRDATLVRIDKNKGKLLHKNGHSHAATPAAAVAADNW